MHQEIYSMPTKRPSLCLCCRVTRLQVCSDSQWLFLPWTPAGNREGGHTWFKDTLLSDLLGNSSVLEGSRSLTEIRLHQPASFTINKGIRYQALWSCNSVFVIQPSHCMTMSNELWRAKTVFLQWNIQDNFPEIPGDNKSLLVQSTKALMLMQHQQQTTL